MNHLSFTFLTVLSYKPYSALAEQKLAIVNTSSSITTSRWLTPVTLNFTVVAMVPLRAYALA